MTNDLAIKILSGDVLGTTEQTHEAVAMAVKALSALPSTQPLVLTCDGCRHVGTYDTDFPCSGCLRREKDYYEQER